LDVGQYIEVTLRLHSDWMPERVDQEMCDRLKTIDRNSELCAKVAAARRRGLEKLPAGRYSLRLHPQGEMLFAVTLK